MGSFAGFLGSAAGGYAQAAREDTQRQFETEQNRRGQLVDMLGKLAQDPTVHPETQQAALQMAMETLHAPWNKPIKPDINKLITAGPAQPTQTATSQGQQSSVPHDLTNLIPKGQPMPTPPGGIDPGFSMTPPAGAAQHDPGFSVAPPTGTANIDPGFSIGSTTAQGRPMPSLPQQAQFTPPPNMGMRYTPAEQAQIAGQEHQAVAGGQMAGQIGARQKAIEGGASPYALGIPGMAGLVGAYGTGDTMPAQTAASQGIALPDGIDPNGWVRVQRNKLGQIVGAYPAIAPAAYAPTETHGFTYQTDASGNTVAVPVTTTKQKQLPTPPGQAAAAQPQAKVEPAKGTKVGKMKPPQAIMIAPPSEPGGTPTAVAVRPGSKVPAGSVTPGGLSSANVPTSTIRTMAQRSASQLPALQRLDNELTRIDKMGKLGPWAGRINKFKMGAIGAGDPDYAYFKDKTEMLKSAIQLIHTGARGSPPILKKFDEMLDAGKMDEPTLRAGLRVLREQLTDYSKEGTIPGFEQNAPPTPPSAAGGSDFFGKFGGTVR